MGFFSRNRIKRLQAKEERLTARVIRRSAKMEELSKVKSLEISIQKQKAAISAQRKAAFDHSRTGRALKGLGRGALATHKAMQKAGEGYKKRQEAIRKRGLPKHPQQSKRYRDTTIEINGTRIKLQGKPRPKPAARKRPTQKQRGLFW